MKMMTKKRLKVTKMARRKKRRRRNLPKSKTRG